MLSDSKKHMRELALPRVLKAHGEKSQKLRVFQVPEINMDAKSLRYYGLITWQSLVTETDANLFQITVFSY